MMRRTVAALVLAILVVAALGTGYLAVDSGRQTSTSTSTTSVEEHASTTTSAVSSSGLELRVGLNATTMLPGGTLAANVTLFNTLNAALSVSPFVPSNSTNLVQSWSNHDFLCGYDGPDGYLASFAVFSGHYSAGNLSQAPSPLQLAAPAGLPCMGIVWPEDEMISFLPHSDNASIPGTYPGWAPVELNVTTQSCIALPSGSSQCHRGTGLFGYWSTTSIICCPANSTTPRLFRYLTPGDYTLVAEDIWGQSVSAYFQVVQGASASEAVSAQESPFSGPASPIIGLTLANFGDVPIVSLNATLSFVQPDGLAGPPVSYPFAIEVNSSAPLLPGQVINETRTLNGSLFYIGPTYPLTISGTLANGTEFTYTQQIQFVNSVPSW